MKTSKINSAANVIAHLSNTRGSYIDGHSGKVTKSKHFAVLSLGEARYVCPLPDVAYGSSWVTTLNPITVDDDNVVRMSVMAVHTLNQKGVSVFDAALAFNECFKAQGAQILDIFTVL